MMDRTASQSALHTELWTLLEIPARFRPLILRPLSFYPTAMELDERSR